MSVSKPQQRLNRLKTNISFLAKVLLSPRFYEIISEPLKNMSQLDSTLGTICYASLFLSVMVKKFPQLKKLISELKPKLIKYIRNFFKVLIRRILVGVMTLISQLKEHTLRSNKLNKLTGIFCTAEELISRTLNKSNKEEDNITNDEKTPKLSTTDLTNKELHISTTLKSLSRYISDVRMFYRGFQIPQAIADLLSSPPQLWADGQYIDLLSIISICLYQPFETTAFLLDKSWLLPAPEGPEKCEWWYLTSTKLWFFWVGVEFCHSLKDTIKETKGDLKCHGRPSIHLLLRAMAKIDQKKWVVLLEHLATLPLCLHWSLADGCLNDWQVGLFGTLAGGLSTTLIWKDVWNKVLNEFIQ